MCSISFSIILMKWKCGQWPEYTPSITFLPVIDYTLTEHLELGSSRDYLELVGYTVQLFQLTGGHTNRK